MFFYCITFNHFFRILFIYNYIKLLTYKIFCPENLMHKDIMKNKKAFYLHFSLIYIFRRQVKAG